MRCLWISNYLEVARMIRVYFLQQNGFDPVDAYSGLNTHAMARAHLLSKKKRRKQWQQEQF